MQYKSIIIIDCIVFSYIDPTKHFKLLTRLEKYTILDFCFLDNMICCSFWLIILQ